MPVKIGYVRVSKQDGSQLLDLQMDAMRAEGIPPQRIYHDHASGRLDSRPGLEACLKALQPQNIFVIWKLDRLGRSLKHLVNTIDDLQQRGVGFKVLAGEGSQINTATASGKLMFSLFAALAEFEAELIRERTHAGFMAARARGRKGGRPRKVTPQVLNLASAALANRTTKVNELARSLNLNRVSLYRYLNGDGSLKERGQRLLDRAGSECTK